MAKLIEFHQLKKQRERTLKVSLPCTIKDKKNVEDLFVGTFNVKLPRQSSRTCRVVFSSAEERIKNQKLAKGKTINGKRIVVQSLRVPTRKKEIKKKIKKKKIIIPKIEPDIKVTKTLFVSSILVGTKPREVKGSLPGCVSVTLLKPYSDKFRSAIVRMEDFQIAADYLKEKLEWPTLKGYKLCLKVDTRQKHKRKISNTIKIHNNTTDKCKPKLNNIAKCNTSDYIEENDETD